MAIRRLTHFNGTALSALFPKCSCSNEARIKIESFEDPVLAKQSVTSLPGEHGGVQGKPLRDVRRFTIRGLIGGNPCCMDEPMRVLKRIFATGVSSVDTVTLGLSDTNFPGAGQHWTIQAMSDGIDFSDTGRQNLVRWQVTLTAADPDYVGRMFSYTLSEGYAVEGKTYDYEHDYTYGIVTYVNGKTVFLEGSVESKMSATITGPATNPRILNVTTGEYMQITATLVDGDIVEIDEDNVVRLNGQFRNSLREVGHGRLPTLIPGINEIVLVDDTHPFDDSDSPTATFSYTTRD